MVFFRDVIGKTLTYPWVKIGVVVSFVVYITVAIYGCLNVKEGMEIYDLFGYDSYARSSSFMESKYLYQYLFRFQLMVEGTLDYSDVRVQNQIEEMLLQIAKLEHISDTELTESWMRYFHTFQKDPRTQWMVKKYNLTSKKDFIHCLRYGFLKFPPAMRFKSDLIFDKNHSEILSSRYYVHSTGLRNIFDIQNTLVAVREITDAMPFKVNVFNYYFPLLDLSTVIYELALKAILVSTAIVLVIAFVFIPSYISCFWIAFSIVSIEIGLIGFLSLWDVSLNPISLVSLIMCIGFSVDNSAHIAYAYVSTPKGDPNWRLRQALYYVGLPIFQSSGSTVAGVILFFFWPPSYNYLVLFKTLGIVMFLSTLHSLFLIPVLLTFLDRSEESKTQKEIKYSEANGQSTHFGALKELLKEENLSIENQGKV